MHCSLSEWGADLTHFKRTDSALQEAQDVIQQLTLELGAAQAAAADYADAGTKMQALTQ